MSKTNWWDEYSSLKDSFFNSLKKREGGNKMETKSRYEVTADLEQKKRELIRERDSFGDRVISKKKEIKDTQRELEDLKEDLTEFEKTMKFKKETIKELIKGIESSLVRFGKLQTNK